MTHLSPHLLPASGCGLWARGLFKVVLLAALPLIASCANPICVVGAGFSGLSTVLRLNEKGFENIVVFEKASGPGGKAKTWMDPNGKVFNLGPMAGVHGSYNITTGFLDKFGVPYSYEDTPVFWYEAMTGHVLDKSSLPNPDWSAITDAFVRYVKIQDQYSHYLVPGFTKGIPEELALPFSEFLANNDLNALLPGLWFAINAFGYGALNEIPAIYGLVYMSSPTMYFSVRPGPEGVFFTDYNRLAREIAGSVKATFVYNVDIEDVQRSSKDVTVVYRTSANRNSATQKCRDIVLAVPHLLSGLSAFNLDETESEIFGAVKSVQYFSTPVKMSKAVKGRFYNLLQFVPSMSPPIVFDEPKGNGQPVFVQPQYFTAENGSDYFIAYSWKQGTEPVRTETVSSMVLDLARHLSGGDTDAVSVQDVEDVVAWDYFPHVDSQAIKGGWFNQFESLQGHRRTYYTSSVRFFENVEASFQSAFDLVDRYFDPLVASNRGSGGRGALPVVTPKWKEPGAPGLEVVRQRRAWSEL